MAYVIHWVSEDVDTSVGGTPQVAIIRDDDPKIQWLNAEEIEKQGKLAKERKANLWRYLAQ